MLWVQMGNGTALLYTRSCIIKYNYFLEYIVVRARGLGAAARLGQNYNIIFFWQKLNFSGRSQQPKMKKKHIFLYLLNEKTELILSSEIKCPKSSGIFTIN